MPEEVETKTETVDSSIVCDIQWKSHEEVEEGKNRLEINFDIKTQVDRNLLNEYPIENLLDCNTADDMYVNAIHLLRRNIILHSEDELNQQEDVHNEKMKQLERFDKYQQSVDEFCTANRPEQYPEDTWKRMSSKNKLATVRRNQNKLMKNIKKHRRIAKHNKRELKSSVKQFYTKCFNEQLKNN